MLPAVMYRRLRASARGRLRKVMAEESDVENVEASPHIIRGPDALSFTKTPIDSSCNARSLRLCSNDGAALEYTTIIHKHCHQKAL